MKDVPARGSSRCIITETIKRVTYLCNSRWHGAPCVISPCELVLVGEAGRSARDPDNGRPCDMMELEFIFSFIPQFWFEYLSCFPGLRGDTVSHKTDKVCVLMELKFQEGTLEINKYVKKIIVDYG